MSTPYLIAARRTPLGKLTGALASFSAPELASMAMRAAVADANIDPVLVEEVILGQVLQAGAGQAPARQALLLAGLPVATTSVTINRVCGSGLDAITQAARMIRAGDARVVVAGGMESMSRAPHLLPTGRTGVKFGDLTLLDALQHDGLTCATEKLSMGAIADRLATQHSIAREELDAFALESHHRAAKAQELALFQKEIVPISITTKSGTTTEDRDEGPRPGIIANDLARLRPAFDPAGTTTAGNASQISDGAAAVVVVSEEIASHATGALRAKIVATSSVSRAPRDLFEAPIDAVYQLLNRARWNSADVDLWEINEAFASQTIACMRGLSIEHDRLNVHGGAIALGHPIGCSGARVVVTLLHALAARGLSRGVATLCLGGGGAVAIAVELQP